VRKTTKTVVGLLSLGVMGASWSMGQAAETGLSLDTTVAAGSAGSETTNTAAPSESASPSANTGTNQPTATETATPAPSASASKSSSAKSTSHVGNSISYEFGVIQVEVVKSGSKITDVNLVKAGATHGREQVFPTLVDAAIAANGTGFDFGNQTGATYTIAAFKQALDSALAKF
jgi:uncharacterized protein with FMN-binding domain